MKNTKTRLTSARVQLLRTRLPRQPGNTAPSRPGRPRTPGGVVMFRWVLRFLCTHREACKLTVHKKVIVQDRGAYKRKAGLLFGGGTSEGARLNDNQIVAPRKAKAPTANE